MIADNLEKKTIFFSAGGTGGHIFPALAVAKLFLNEANIVWVGATVGLENEIIPKHNIPLETIKISGFRKKSFSKMATIPFKLIYAFFQAARLIQKYRPNAIVGFGGYATFPICIMGRMLGVPVLIHEQNAVPGLSNKILAKFVNVVMVAFKHVLTSSKTIVVGNPIREEILTLETPDIRYGKKHGDLNVLILGGSLGAKVFNDILPSVFAKTNNIATITHQVGRGDKSIVLESYKKHNIKANVVNFIDDMASAYREADLIICRSGASTVSEIAACGVATIFVPYPYAVDDHQYYNAKYLEEVLAAKVMRQSDVTVSALADCINSFDRKLCLKMANNASLVAKPNSSHDIYQIIVRTLN